MQVVINNLLVKYNKQGSGPVVLLLHGWGDTEKTFKDLIIKLKKQYCCVSLDLPGFGDSQAPIDVWGINDYAEFVQEFIDKIDIQPQYVIGHSNGGTIAMYLAAHKLLNPKKLILLSSAGIRDEQNLKRLVYKVIAKTGNKATKVLPVHIRSKLRKKLYKTAGSDIFVSPALQDTFKKVVGYDIKKDAEIVSQPTLLVFAKDDIDTPVRYGEKLNRVITNSKLEVLENGGHFIHQTQTDKVVDLIMEFIK